MVSIIHPEVSSDDFKHVSNEVTKHETFVTENFDGS